MSRTKWISKVLAVAAVAAAVPGLPVREELAGAAPTYAVTWVKAPAAGNSMWEEITRLRAGSLTEVAEAWLHLFARGWIYFDASPPGGWVNRPGIPLYMRLSGLI
jgi:hypothetical protein